MSKNLLLALLLPAILCGCLRSFVPLSDKNEATPEGLVGTWISEKAEYVVTLKQDRYEIEGKTLKDGKKDGPYEMAVAKIGDSLYAQIVFDMDKAGKAWPEEVKRQVNTVVVQPVIWIFKLKLEGDSLKLLIHDDSSCASVFAEGEDKDVIPVALHSRANLRAWLEKNGDKAFKEDKAFSFVRKK